MFLKNGKKLFNGLHNGTDYVYLKNEEGIETTINPAYEKLYTYSTSESETNSVKIVAGDGDTAVTADDYALKNKTMVFETGIIGRGDTTTVITATHTNNTSEAQIVKEFGVHTTNALITRTVLDTPIVINPNETYSISITFSF